MHHVLVDRWSRGTSRLHARDPRAKILAVVAFLIVLATTPPHAAVPLMIYTVLLLAGILIAGLPVGSVALRGMAVLPFSLTFGLISWLAGDALRAQALVEKSYLSAVAVLLLAGTTPLPLLLQGLEALGTPRFLVMVTQFLYRYLFVISEQAQHFRLAAACREGAHKKHRRMRFRGAAGALAVLFARSYYRAEGIHRAMLARSFSGRFGVLGGLHFRASDLLFTLAIGMFLIVVRVQ